MMKALMGSCCFSRMTPSQEQESKIFEQQGWHTNQIEQSAYERYRFDIWIFESRRVLQRCCQYNMVCGVGLS
jgi:IS5 family transposase